MPAQFCDMTGQPAEQAEHEDQRRDQDDQDDPGEEVKAAHGFVSCAAPTGLPVAMTIASAKAGTFRVANAKRESPCRKPAGIAAVRLGQSLSLLEMLVDHPVQIAADPIQIPS